MRVFGHLVSRLAGLKAKRRETPIQLEPVTRQETETPQPECMQAIVSEPPAVDPSVPAPQLPAPPVQLPEVPIPGSDLLYYKPFGPNDDIYDVWQKLQTFVSAEPITLRLMPSDGTAPIVESAFCPNGTPQSTREMFFQELVNGIRNAGASVFRAVRPLSSFGISSLAPEGAYHFFTGSLSMELKGVQVMGLAFSVRAAFEPNLGLIPEYFSHAAEYFHCEVSSGDSHGRGRSKPAKVLVGFPWSLTSITLYSTDAGLDDHAAGITQAIVDKYAKYVKQNQVVMPTPEDANRKMSMISDEVVVIAVDEGILKTKASQGRFLRIDYSPYPKGLADQVWSGDAEFMKFAREISGRAESVKPCFAGKPEVALNMPF
jgi:hypothetical protein